MSSRLLMTFLAALLAVLGVVITAPAHAAPASVPREVLTSMTNDPDAVACLENLTCLEDDHPNRRTFTECMQDHQRRVNAATQGRTDPPLHSYAFGQTPPTVEEVVRKTCFQDRTTDLETTLERNAELSRKIRTLRAELVGILADCANGTAGEIPPLVAELPDEHPSLAQARGQTRLFEDYLRTIRTRMEIAERECASSDAILAKTSPKKPVTEPQPAKTAVAPSTAPARTGTGTAGPCGLEHFEVRHKDDDHVDLYVLPGAYMAELQRSCLAKTYETGDRAVFDGNEYRDTIPYCTADGKLPRSKDDFDPYRWNFEKGRTAVHAEFADSCKGRFGIALQAKQVITLTVKAKPAQAPQTKTDGEKPGDNADPPPSDPSIGMPAPPPAPSASAPVPEVTPYIGPSPDPLQDAGDNSGSTVVPLRDDAAPGQSFDAGPGSARAPPGTYL